MVARARRLERFLTQPFLTTEQFTGLAGKLVSSKDALDGCERSLRDEFKDFPESAPYMNETIDEATERKTKAASNTTAPFPQTPGPRRLSPHRTHAHASSPPVRRQTPEKGPRKHEICGLGPPLSPSAELRLATATVTIKYAFPIKDSSSQRPET